MISSFFYGIISYDKKTFKIPNVDKAVFPLVFGTMNSALAPNEKTYQFLDGVLNAGINTFDTARVYWNSERTLGNWMESRQNREKLVLIAKGAHPSFTGRGRLSSGAVKKDLQKSLSLLKTEYIDIYFLHRDDPSQPVGPLVETLNELHDQGKIKAFGGSNWTHRRLAEANEYARNHNLIPFSVSSPNFGVAEQCGEPWGGGSVSLSGPKEKDARDWYEKNAMPLFAYSSLAMGLLSGKIKSSDFPNARKLLGKHGYRGYGSRENFERLRRIEEIAEKKSVQVVQIALAWMMHQPMTVLPIFTTASLERVKKNIESLEISLSPGEEKYINLEEY